MRHSVCGGKKQGNVNYGTGTRCITFSFSMRTSTYNRRSTEAFKHGIEVVC